jgi:hypothetical protein
MTPAEQKAWIAGRDAAVKCLPKLTDPWDAYGFGFFDGLESAAAYIRALTPPDAIEWSTGAPPVHVSDRSTRKGVMPIDDNNTHTRPDVAPGGNTLSGGVTPPDATPPTMPPLAEVIAHYGIDALCRALVPEIVREAGEATATAWTPPEDRADGFMCQAILNVEWSKSLKSWCHPIGSSYRTTVNPDAFAPLPEGKP